MSNFWEDEGSKLFSYTFNDTIYELDKEGVKPKIVLDFGERRFPSADLSKDFQDVREFLDYCKTTSYAYNLSNIGFNDDFLQFTYQFGGERRYGVYDKSDGRTATIRQKGDISDQLYYFLGYPRGTGKSCFYFEIEPSRLISVMEEAKASVGNREWQDLEGTNAQLVGFYKTLSIDDGNILVRAKRHSVK